jgi:hypothetical protein
MYDEVRGSTMSQQFIMFKNYEKLKKKIDTLEKSFDINACEEK